jgi:hypothetical protein
MSGSSVMKVDRSRVNHRDAGSSGGDDAVIANLATSSVKETADSIAGATAGTPAAASDT